MTVRRGTRKSYARPRPIGSACANRQPPASAPAARWLLGSLSSGANMTSKMSVGTGGPWRAAPRIAVSVLAFLAVVAVIAFLRLAWFFLLRD